MIMTIRYLNIENLREFGRWKKNMKKLYYGRPRNRKKQETDSTYKNILAEFLAT